MAIENAVFAVCFWFLQTYGPVCEAYGFPPVVELPISALTDKHLDSEEHVSDETRAFLTEYLEGLFDPEAGIIYVRDDLDWSTIRGQSVLVHEYVHFIQFEENALEELDCVQQLERGAYTIQNEWMAFHGKEPYMDEFSIKLYSMCAIP